MTTQLVCPVVCPVVCDEALVQRMQQYHYLIANSRLKFQFNQHQYDGVQWCVKNELRPNSFVRGGFLSDEMGLGKTILMIGTMFVHFLKRTLIVVPPSLIQQWYKEIYNVSGHKALIFYGNNKKIITRDIVNASPIVLTTYNTIIDRDCLLNKLVWNRVIFDEAHHLRNSNTMRFKAAKQLKAGIRWLVTGTPIQNKPRDFYNLCSICGWPLVIVDGKKVPENLNMIINKFVLRRTKRQVGINLPPVTKTQRFVNWQTRGEMLFAQEIHSLIPNITGVVASKNEILKASFGTRGATLAAMLLSRQVCVLPALIATTKKMKLFNEGSDIINYSSKLDAVVELIVSRKDNKKGKIVFCHFKNEIDTIARRLEEGGLTKVVRYDGRNSGGKNLASLSEPADALVIQIQTGCEGLNLQKHFSEIYFVSPHWNPSVEEQAIARCHRIGQVNSVEVFKFEMIGSGFDTMSVCDSNDGIQKVPITLDKHINHIQDKKRDFSKILISL